MGKIGRPGRKILLGNNWNDFLKIYNFIKSIPTPEDMLEDKGEIEDYPRWMESEKNERKTLFLLNLKSSQYNLLMQKHSISKASFDTFCLRTEILIERKSQSDKYQSIKETFKKWEERIRPIFDERDTKENISQNKVCSNEPIIILEESLDRGDWIITNLKGSFEYFITFRMKYKNANCNVFDNKTGRHWVCSTTMLDKYWIIIELDIPNKKKSMHLYLNITHASDEIPVIFGDLLVGLTYNLNEEFGPESDTDSYGRNVILLNSSCDIQLSLNKANEAIENFLEWCGEFADKSPFWHTNHLDKILSERNPSNIK